MIHIIRMFVINIVSFVMAHSAYAAWVGPSEMLSGEWGDGENQFAIERGDTEDYYPLLTDVSIQNDIAISDDLNSRVKIYSASGLLIRNITPPIAEASDFVLEGKFIGVNVVIPADKYYFYSSSGAISNQQNIPGRTDYFREHNGQLYVEVESPENKWLVYSPDGTLLNTYAEKPLQLGHISKDIFGFQGEKTYRITVKYPDKEWKIISLVGPCSEYAYQRDASGNLYCVGEKNIQRYSSCGKVVSEFSIPADVETERDRGVGVEPDITVHEGYGNIEMADNGDIYTSKVTPTHFSVIKWTWQANTADKVGGPDAPTEFAANVLGAEVKLAWYPSLQDPGCVTGYEVSRATVTGGPYTVLNTTAAGAKDYTDTTVQSGNTYYYKIRAMSGVANSDYTPEKPATLP